MRSTSIRRAGGILACSLLFVLGACGDDEETPEGGETEETAGGATETTAAAGSDDGVTDGDAVITIEGFAYNDLTVAPGTEITVTNLDGAPHTVTAKNGEFDSGNISGGDTGSITAPHTPGTYEYFCAVHGESSMSGTLVVE